MANDRPNGTGGRAGGREGARTRYSGELSIVPVCASPIYRHYPGHRYYRGSYKRVSVVSVVPGDSTGTTESSGTIQPALLGIPHGT